MIIVGTGGLAKDVISSMELDSNGTIDNIKIFNNINFDINILYGYTVLHNFDELKVSFSSLSNKYLVCIGNTLLRKRVSDKLKSLGGDYACFISNKSSICPLIEGSNGLVIQAGCVVSREVIFGEGTFVNANAVIGHDVKIGEYVSIGPGAKILGNAEIGDFSYIGTNSVIMPGVKVGKKVRIGVGRIIDENIPDNSKVM